MNKEQHIPDKGILSQTLFENDHVRAVLFGFASGEKLTEHTARVPAILHVLSGRFSVTLGRDAKNAAAGAWIYMAPHLPHSLLAESPSQMILYLLRVAPADPLI